MIMTMISKMVIMIDSLLLEMALSRSDRGSFLDLLGHDGEGGKPVRPEARDHRDVGGVAPAGDQNTANPGLIVPRVEGEPSAPEKDFEPGVEIHRRRVRRNADVAEIAVAIARGNVEAAAQGDCEMGEVPAHADPLRQGFARGP